MLVDVSPWLMVLAAWLILLGLWQLAALIAWAVERAVWRWQDRHQPLDDDPASYEDDWDEDDDPEPWDLPEERSWEEITEPGSPGLALAAALPGPLPDGVRVPEWWETDAVWPDLEVTP